MRAMIWFVVFFLSATITSSYAAETGLCSPNQIKTTIFFGNGIDNTQDEARRSKELLEIRLSKVFTRDQLSTIELKLAYNNTHNKILDIFESVKQKVAGDTYVDSFWRWVSNVDPMPDWFQEIAKQKLTEIDQTTLVSDGDLTNHLVMYRSSILEGKKVIVVAHSQGNLFANAAYNVLYNGADRITSRSFGIVSVANPASFVGGNGPYTTLSSDLVILAVRALSVAPVAPPLLSNVANAVRSTDSLGHNFLNAYLPSGSASETMVLTDILTVVQGLDQPPAVAQDGIITATLTWGAEPDVDLHAFEPNGAHVYYARLVGTSGHLDLDDTSGYGPEHYYVACTALETGTYSIGVNYFGGYGPETAHVQIKAGTIVRNYTIPLSVPLGGSGDANPIPVASITVTGDVRQGFQFSVAGTP